jgi:hypothetical protein
MTDKKMTAEKGSEEYFDRLRRRRVDVDWFLQMWVRWANEANAKGLAGVTLIVGGTLVSGVLVGVRRYFEGIADVLAAAMPDEEDKAVRQWFADLGEQHKADEPEPSTPEEFEERELAGPHYIHLRDAHIFQADRPLPTGEGVWWRGRLEAVEGFMFGILGEAPKPD